MLLRNQYTNRTVVFELTDVVELNSLQIRDNHSERDACLVNMKNERPVNIFSMQMASLIYCLQWAWARYNVSNPDTECPYDFDAQFDVVLD